MNAPMTKEAQALGAFLAAMHDSKLDGAEMRKAMLSVLGAAQAEPVARDDLLERYAQAAHWYINAHDNELQEHGDTREAAIRRVHALDGELLASGYEWLASSPTQPRPQPLTDEQIADIVREAAKGSAMRRDGTTSTRIARAIEAAHGITAQEPTE